MTKRIILLGLVCGTLASSTGCGLLPCVFCPTSTCDQRYCTPTPGPGCGPTCAGACEPACEPACGPDSPAVCNQSCPPAPTCGPLTWVFGLFDRGGVWYGDSCGETYYGHFAGDPPDCCDPCDRYGNYTGGGAGGFSGGCAAGMAPQQVGVAPAPRVVRRPETIAGTPR